MTKTTPGDERPHEVQADASSASRGRRSSHQWRTMPAWEIENERKIPIE